MVESTSSTCPVPFPQVRARVIRFRNWEKEGWLGVGEGKPCPSAILCESQLLRRVRAPCPQPLELPSQSVFPAPGVSRMADSSPCRCTCEDERAEGSLGKPLPLPPFCPFQ